MGRATSMIRPRTMKSSQKIFFSTRKTLPLMNTDYTDRNKTQNL